MSKKHFIAMAIQFALLRKEILNRNMSTVHKAHQLSGVSEAQDAFCKVAIQSNPNFDKYYFLDFIDDIAAGKRDNNGKLIKTKKVA